jgi:hypothetical protein
MSWIPVKPRERVASRTVHEHRLRHRSSLARSPQARDGCAAFGEHEGAQTLSPGQRGTV